MADIQDMHLCFVWNFVIEQNVWFKSDKLTRFLSWDITGRGKGQLHATGKCLILNIFLVLILLFSENASEFTEHCNVFDFMIGFIFYTGDIGDSTNAIVDLFVRYPQPFQLDNAAYDALYIASQFGDIKDPVTREKAYEFCYSATYQMFCSIIVFDFYEPNFQTVSDTYYQLFKGACTDSFTIPQEQWNNLQTEPPVRFQQDYFQCTQEVRVYFIALFLTPRSGITHWSIALESPREMQDY